jgi:predicted metal-dependent enzyme (double-stranded beta helix superfamily)
MPIYQKMPPELHTICNRWCEALNTLKYDKDRIEYVRNELPALLNNQAVFVELLSNIAGGYPYPDIRKAQLFEDEILLYLSTKPTFSIRMFIYEPGVFTPIHDHTSWGVIGSALGKIGVTNYIREDDGARPGYALIRESDKLILDLGETNVALPLNQGIHQTGNPGHHISIMVSVYGRPIRRLYIHRFDPDNNSVYRMYPPRMKKKMLAAGALDILEGK